MSRHFFIFAAAYLLATHWTRCANVRDENRKTCIKESFAKSSVREEDRARTVELLEQVFDELQARFSQGEKPDGWMSKPSVIFANKVLADKELKGKTAAIDFFRQFVCCLSGKSLTWNNMRCQEARAVNQGRLTDEDLRKLIQAANAAGRQRGGQPVPDDDLKRIFAQKLGNEEKGQVALEVHKTLAECQKKWRG